MWVYIDEVKRKLMVAALLLLVALPVWNFLEDIDRAGRSADQIHDSIRIGMPIKDVDIFSTDPPNTAGKADLVICTAQQGGPLLDRDNWRDLKASGSGFPPACRTMRVRIRGVGLGPGDNLFYLEFDESWRVSKIGEMSTRLQG